MAIPDTLDPSAGLQAPTSICTPHGIRRRRHLQLRQGPAATDAAGTNLPPSSTFQLAVHRAAEMSKCPIYCNITLANSSTNHRYSMLFTLQL